MTEAQYLYRIKQKQYNTFIKDLVECIFRNEHILQFFIQNNLLTRDQISYYEQSSFTSTYRKKRCRVNIRRETISLLFK